jgi:dTDP-4-dehydrorhamnose reductase
MTLEVRQQRRGDGRQNRLLIVGASGFIGGLLFQHFAGRGFHTLGTQSTGKRSEFIHFDLKSQRLPDVVPPQFFTGDARCVACICAACASVEACGRDPVGSRAINVTGTIRLIDHLAALGSGIIFFSTSAVHDGKLAKYDESVPAHPINEYGRQKAEVEQYLISRFPEAIVVRLSKAIDLAPAPRNLFTEWERHLAEGRPIECIEHETFSPTWVEDISTAVERLIAAESSGLFHVANSECFTRDGLARLFLQKMGRELPLVLRPAESFGFREPRPVSSCLDNRKLLQAVGMRFRSAAELLDMYLAKHAGIAPTGSP